jgi:hypothetical protein
MPTLTQLVTSTMYVWQQIESTDLSGNAIDPTGDAAFLAFVPQPQYGPPPNPTSGQLNPAIWRTSTSGGNTLYWAGTLIGPANSGIVLTQGAYVIGFKAIDSPEVPVLWSSWNLLIV